MKNQNDLWYELCSKHNCLLVDTFDAIHYGKLSDKEYVENLKQRFDKINLAYIELYEQYNQSMDQSDG